MVPHADKIYCLSLISKQDLGQIPVLNNICLEFYISFFFRCFLLLIVNTMINYTCSVLSGTSNSNTFIATIFFPSNFASGSQEKEFVIKKMTNNILPKICLAVAYPTHN